MGKYKGFKGSGMRETKMPEYKKNQIALEFALAVQRKLFSEMKTAARRMAEKEESNGFVEVSAEAEENA